MVSLFPHQIESKAKINAVFDRGINRALAALATGTGKTILGLDWMRERGGRGLFICPFDAVVKQSYDAARAVFPHRSVGVVQADLNQWNADIVVASLHTIQKDKRLAKLSNNLFTSIVVDECHLMPKAYLKVLGKLENPLSKTLGLSATPVRLPGDKINLDDIWQEKAVEIGIEEAVEMDLLAPPVGVKVSIKGADFSGVNIVRGDFDQSQIETVMSAANWRESLTEQWRKLASDRKTLIFFGSVKQAHAMAEYMRSVGIRAESLDGSMSDQRPAMKRRLETGETQVLCNVGTLTTGFDCPAVDCIIMSRFTASRALYIQIVGRSLRKFPGKTEALIIDVVGNFKKHSFGFDDIVGAKKKAETEKRETLREARERQQREAEEEERERLEQERIEQERVQLLRRQKEQREQREQAQRQRQAERWQQGVDGRWTYEAYGVVFTIRPMASGNYTASSTNGFRVFADTVEDAMKACSEPIKKLIFTSPDAAWRSKPATPQQLKNLDKWRVRHDPAITAGQASDLLSQVFQNFKSRRKAA